MPDTRVFYKKNYVYAWVPNNTLVNGHVMLCPIKGEQRYRDLTNPELFEIALAMRELSEIIKTALRPKQ